jgi:predicted TIM-barrel fold metal-dependent hydrolase
MDAQIAGNDFAFCSDGRDQNFNYFDAICNHFGKLGNLDNYLDALDKTIDGSKNFGVKAIKTAFAYTVGLSFSDPSYKETAAAFCRKRKMDPGQVKTVRDYAFRHCLSACKRNNLPIVIHTGFQIWGHSNLAQSNPLLLHNLIIDKKFRDLTFVLLHGGNPYTGETTYLATMFPNVMLDFTWIAWMSRTRFRAALMDWLEMVPKEKFCWGSDSSSVESIAGIDHTVRHLIAETLNESINCGIIDEEYAAEFIHDCYYNNPKRIFNL